MRTGEKLGSAHFRIVGFLNGTYDCSRLGSGSRSWGGADGVALPPALGGGGEPEVLAGTNVGGAGGIAAGGGVKPGGGPPPAMKGGGGNGGRMPGGGGNAGAPGGIMPAGGGNGGIPAGGMPPGGIGYPGGGDAPGGILGDRQVSHKVLYRERLTEASCLVQGTAGLQKAEQREAHLKERRLACPAATSSEGA